VFDTQPFDLYTPDYTQRVPRPVLADDPVATQFQRGFYFQDQMRAGNLIAVVGLRRDEVANQTEFALTEKSEATTQRYGLMYELPYGFTPYVSYAESFDPIAGLDRNFQAFDPIEGVQREAGLKYLSPNDRLLVTASVYDIVEQNRLAPDPLDPLNSVQTGEAEFQGFDIEAQGKVTDRLTIHAAYAYTEALVTEGVNAGFRVDNIPEHLASLWAKRDFSLFGREGYWVGAGVRYVSETFDGVDNFTTPDFTLFDAAIGYEDEKWRAQVNGSNLEDKVYLSACLARGDCFYGTGRKITATLVRKF
jgi:iron complex outermembrane receptor protein